MKSERDHDEGARNRILRTAASLFAEKGFDGARVDEIARQAGVNKALIYYYFENKEALLSQLFTEVLEASARFLYSPFFSDVSELTQDKARRFLDEFLDFLEERQDILRVMLMESLKRSPTNDLIFTVIERFMIQMTKRIEELGNVRVNEAEIMVIEFFTGIMPVINFVVYHEKWIEKFKVDEPALREYFYRAFLGTHFNYSWGAYWDEKKP